MKKILATMVLSSFLAQSGLAVETFSKLPKNDKFRGLVSGIATGWSDGNITTGTTDAWAAKVNIDVESYGSDDWAELNETNIRQTIKKRAYDDEVLPKKLKFDSRVHNFKASDVTTAVKYLMESNDYAPENREDREIFRRQLWAMLYALGYAEDELLTVISRADVPQVGDDGTTYRFVTQILFVNTVTRKVLGLYLIEGIMGGRPRTKPGPR